MTVGSVVQTRRLRHGSCKQRLRRLESEKQKKLDGAAAKHHVREKEIEEVSQAALQGLLQYCLVEHEPSSLSFFQLHDKPIAYHTSLSILCRSSHTNLLRNV